MRSAPPPGLLDIHERLARIETTQQHTLDVLGRMDGKLDIVDDRLRSVEARSAVYGTVAGGVMSVAVALISAKLRGGV